MGGSQSSCEAWVTALFSPVLLISFAPVLLVTQARGTVLVTTDVPSVLQASLHSSKEALHASMQHLGATRLGAAIAAMQQTTTPHALRPATNPEARGGHRSVAHEFWSSRRSLQY